MRAKQSIVLAFAAVLIMPRPSIAETSITGVWQQIDDETNEIQSLVTISEHGGVYEGRVTKIFVKPGEPANPVCEACSGARKNMPLLGFKVIANVHRHGDVYDGGTITDPEDGQDYSVRLVPSADGRTLAVTGYVGTPMMGRTQTWKRLR